MAISLNKIFELAEIIRDHSLEVPRNIRLKEKADSLTIEYSWFKFKYLILFFLFPACSFTVVQSPYIQGSLDNLTVQVWLILLANLGVLYYCLSRLLNTTIILVNHTRIEIKHGPLPISKDVTIKRSELQQLYVTKKRTAHRYYLYSSTYQVNAILSDKDVITLVKGLYEPEQGQFMEKKIEKFLGITDISVEGEIAKD